MKTKTGKQTLTKFREVKVQPYISTKMIESKDLRIKSVIYPKQFNDFYKLLRITAYVLIFIENHRKKSRQESPDITTK